MQCMSELNDSTIQTIHTRKLSHVFWHLQRGDFLVYDSEFEQMPIFVSDHKKKVTKLAQEARPVQNALHPCADSKRG